MASLEQRNGSYRVVFRLNGQKYTRSLKTSEESQALLALAQLEDNLRRVELGTLAIHDGDDPVVVLLSSGNATKRPQIEKSVSIAQLLDRYLESIPGGSIEFGTLKMLAIHIRHLNRVLGQRTAASQISLTDLQKYVNTRGADTGIRGKPLSPITIRKELTTLRSAWKWAKEMGLVKHDLPVKSRLRYAKIDEKQPFRTWQEAVRLTSRSNMPDDEKTGIWESVYLSKTELNQLLKDVSAIAAAPFLPCMVAFAAYTGARRSEIIRCLIDDVDMEQSVITIREKKRVKGQSSTRSVPIAPQLRKALNSWLPLHPGGTHLFTCNGEPLTRDQAHDYLRRLLDPTQWKTLRGWHALRHSFISNCASTGIDQRIIDSWVGHTTEAMRQRYRHLLPSTQQAAMRQAFG